MLFEKAKIAEMIRKLTDAETKKLQETMKIRKPTDAELKKWQEALKKEEK